jgi:hypothetical protein
MPNSEEPNPGLNFVVSSYCHTGGCVGVAALSDGGVAIRDTKATGGPILTFTAAEWDAFLGGVADGEFNRDALLD